MTNSNLAGPGETVPKQETQAFREIDQITNLEQELENADADFLKAAEAGDLAGMVASHNRVCQAVARMSATLSGTGKPSVFVRHHIEAVSGSSNVAAPPEPSLPQLAEPPTSVAAAPSSPPLVHMTTAELERQIASLAQQMAKCLESGDMEGMLKCNEKMGELSDMIGRQEAAIKEAANSAAADDPLAKITEAAGLKDSPGAKPGGWAAGDTLALARQRAEERKKQSKHSPDTFDIVAGGEPGSTVDLLFSGEKSDKQPLNQEDLRERLEYCSFYEILSSPSTASFEELHKCFFRKIRNLNKRLVAKDLEDWQFQEFVGALCLAHDVLKYPVARMQYDLGLLGGEIPDAKQKLMPLRELIRFSTLVSMLDLMDAGDAAEGKNEREMGYFLVEKGKLSQEEFDSILFAQKLVSAGKLTLAQFELAMQEMRENNIPLLDTLIASEWIQPADVLSADFS
ncbi:MAG: hypothetical protein K2W95_01055 [Candidatus Obscuribacterales bacterium]|nr:hypothetical protein [Candidatus Obscuribacterales bacterium]